MSSNLSFVSQVGNYSFSSLSQNNGKLSTTIFSTTSLLMSCLPLISVLRMVSKCNMRLPITIYHWFMWHCSIFYIVLFFAIFNNLLALLGTAIKAQLSGRALHHVYHRLNCSIKFLNANLPYVNEWNSKTHDKSFHACISTAPFTFLQAHVSAKIAMFYFSPHLLYCSLSASVHRQSCTLALYSVLRTTLCERASACALSSAGGERAKPASLFLVTHCGTVLRTQFHQHPWRKSLNNPQRLLHPCTSCTIKQCKSFTITRSQPITH